MLGDLAKLYDAMQSAQTDQEKLRRATAVDDAVESYLRAEFDNPDYPKRRRSLGALKKGLAIFDEDPISLQTHLVRIGATRQQGTGDDEVWHLPAAGGVSPRRRHRRWLWRKVALVLAALAAAISALLGYLDIAGDEILWIIWPSGETYETCIIAANEIFTEIQACKERFGVRH